MEQEPAINHQVCKHEASHLLIAHLFQGNGAINLIQLPGHRELPVHLRANCVMGDWFKMSNCLHTNIPTLMGGVIADQLARTPFAYCMGDLTGIAARSLYCVDAHIEFFAKSVHKILSSSKGDDVLETVAGQIESAFKNGDDRIEGALLHNTFSKLLGKRFKFDKPSQNMMQVRRPPQVAHGDLEHVIARRIYSEILDAVPSIDIPGFR